MISRLKLQGSGIKCFVIYVRYSLVPSELLMSTTGIVDILEDYAIMPAREFLIYRGDYK
jgi:hypothetical protein